MDNRTRVLNEAVSVDGWIGEFDASGTATVHVDVVFRQGSFGDDPTSPVRFKIALSRAEVVVRVPNEEPISVVRKSIERTVDSTEAVQTIKKSKIRSGRFGLNTALSKIGLSGGAEMSGSIESSNQSELGYSKKLRNFIEQHFTTPDSHPAWDLSANRELVDHLTGAPWNPNEQPRMKVRKTASSRAAVGSVSVVVEIRCAREDIEILDLEEKDPEQQRAFMSKKNRHLHLAAAEQLIKEELFKAGFLEVPDLS